MSPTDKTYLTAFIRNLGRPAEAASRDFSVLAISKQERKLTIRLYEEHSELFNQALVAAFPGCVVRDIFGKEEYQRFEDGIDEEDAKLLREVWNGNEEIFKAVIYQHFVGKNQELGKLFKGNNRDTTKYRVYWGEDNKEVFPGKRLSKAMTACAIFKAYLALHPQTTLEELRKAFPCKDTNAYYWDNYYADLFYPYLPDQVDEHGEQCLAFTAEKRMGEPSLARWDFYLREEQLLILGDGSMAMCVKMWRRGDFDRLMAHFQEMNEQITVKECL
jgi:hypothetical protein